MEINRLFEYHKLPRVTLGDGTRTYETPTGEKVSSVTTILGQTGDKTGLIEWRKRVGDKEANRISSEAAKLGTLVHTHLENFIEEIERPSGNNHVRLMAKQMADVIIESGMKNVTEIWGYEEPLYFPGLYAGTADFIGIHNGSPAIMDFKTTRKMKKEEWVTDYFLQGTAYAMAHNEVYGTDIQKVAIFMVDRENNYQEFVAEGKKFKLFSELWIERLQDFYKKAA